MNPHLSTLQIINLRSIRSETFPLSDFTALVGRNNTGKTSILLGLAWLFHGTALNIHHFRNTHKAVQVTGEITGLTAKELNAAKMSPLVKYLHQGTLRVRRHQEKSDFRISPPLLFFRPQSDRGEAHWKADYTAEVALYQLMPPPITIGAVPDKEGPFGSPSGSELIAQLIGEIVEPLLDQYRPAIQEALQVLEPLFDPGADRPHELQQFDRELNRALEAIFPSLRLQLRVPKPDFNNLLRRAVLRVYEENYPDGQDLHLMGQGAQRAVQMALLRRLAETKQRKNGHPSRRLLLIEEPELHLHPQAVELVRLSLKQLSHEGYQVVFATHSAQMVTAEDVRTCLLIRKDQANGTYMRERIEDAVKRVIHDAPSQLQLLFSLSNSNEMLFADRVALTEGKTELRILPHLYTRLTGDSFLLRRLALVRMGGVSNTKKTLKVLNAIDLPTRAIVDLDYAFTDAIRDRFIEENDPNLSHCLKIFDEEAKKKRIRLVKGIPVTRNSGMSAAEAYAWFAALPECENAIQGLHDTLKSQGIWLWRRGSIEQHLGLSGKGELVWATFVERLKSGEDPRKYLPDYDGVLEMLRWLVQ